MLLAQTQDSNESYKIMKTNMYYIYFNKKKSLEHLHQILKIMKVIIKNNKLEISITSWSANLNLHDKLCLTSGIQNHNKHVKLSKFINS